MTVVSQANPTINRPIRVLVVDDDQNTTTALIRLLKSAKYDAFGLSDSCLAVETARRFRPDVIVCDVAMPGMDGYDVLRALKRDPRTAVIPFIFLSGKSDHEHIRQGMRLGADDYLAKPFESHELFDSIAARIERQRMITRKLEDLQHSLTQSVPHEFFTPLNVILGFSMVVLDGLRNNEAIVPSDLEDTMESIREAGEQLHRIASNYVLYTQLVADGARPLANSSSLESAVCEPELGRAVRKIALARDRMTDLHYSFAPARINIPAEHLEKITSELLENAFKFSKTGEWISVTGVVVDNHYRLRLIDHGCGMTEEQIEELAPHLQLERSKRVQPGVGLGLAIAQLLSCRYGGSLQLSRNAEKGITAEVSLPLVREQPAAKSA